MSSPLTVAGRSFLNPAPAELGSAHYIVAGRGRGREVYYTRDFAGPLSIKTVVRGHARWETEADSFRLDPGAYLVLNDGREYSLLIDSVEPIETFCVFFRRGFVEDVVRVQTTHADELLDAPDAAVAAGFFEAIRPDAPAIASALGTMRRELPAFDRDGSWLDARMTAVAEALADARADVQRERARIGAVRAATRDELFHRVARGRSYIEASLSAPLRLNDVARAACLSPYHFHRLFTQTFGETPHRYVTRRRLDRAERLAARTDRPLIDVALDCGFESPTSFAALFRRRYGSAPSAYRRTSREKSKIEEASPGARP